MTIGNPKSFTAQYRVFRLVYYEEFGDVSAAIAREKQIKGWTRAKKNALVATMNPKWRDLMAEWEKKFGLVFQLDYRIVRAEEVRQQRHQIQGASQNQTQGPSPKIGAQDDTAF